MVNSFFSRDNCSVYEIYPQHETPHLSRIAHLDLDPPKEPLARLLPDVVIWFGFNGGSDKIVFRVWDYRLNHSISFTVDLFVHYEDDLDVCFILSEALKLAFSSFFGR
jgi:hypothetical protein